MKREWIQDVQSMASIMRHPSRTRSRRSGATRKLTVFFEVSDCARALGVSLGAVKMFAASGQLALAAKTARGSRLFRPKDVDAFRRHRKRRLGALVEAGQ